MDKSPIVLTTAVSSLDQSIHHIYPDTSSLEIRMQSSSVEGFLHIFSSPFFSQYFHSGSLMDSVRPVAISSGAQCSGSFTRVF